MSDVRYEIIQKISMLSISDSGWSKEELVARASCPTCWNSGRTTAGRFESESATETSMSAPKMLQ